MVLIGERRKFRVADASGPVRKLLQGRLRVKRHWLKCHDTIREMPANESVMPKSRMRRVVARVFRGPGRIVALIVLLLALAMVIGGLLIRDRHSEVTLTSAAKVRVELENGQLTLRKSADDAFVLHRRDEYVLRGPAFEHRIEGEVLVIEIECPRVNLGRCTSEVDLSIPGLTEIVANVENGNISTRELQGAAELRASNGKIETDGTFGPVDMDVGNGAISGKDLSSTEVRARTANGAVELEFSTAPRSVDAETGNGDVKIQVPKESGPFAVDASTGNGKTTVDARDDDSSPNRIRARSGNGDVSVDRR